MERTLNPQDVRRLDARAPLQLDPAATIAIKRDVHEFDIDGDAPRFVRAFRDVMIDPQGMFGLIRVRRPDDRAGRDFEVGERFQGCFSVERAVLGALQRGGHTAAQKVAQAIFARRTTSRVITWIEDQMLSDYAEIEVIDLDPPPGQPYTLRYRYLEGTPIAGSSVFVVEATGPRSCRVRQVFEYQEINGVALGTFQRFGLKYHDQVVHMQIHKAAERIGAQVVRSTIPADYARMAH